MDLLRQALWIRVTAYLRAPSSLVLELLYISFMLAVIVASAASTRQAAAIEPAVMSFLVWMMFTMVTMSGAEWISSEALQGKLDRTLSGPRSHLVLIFSEILGSAIIGLVRYVIAAGLMLTILRVPLHNVALDLFVVAALFVFYLSLSLAIAAVTLVRRSAAMWQSFFQMGMLGLALASNSASGSFVEVLRWFPFTNGIAILTGRTQNLQASVIAMIVSLLVSAVTALLVFAYCDEAALRRGTLFSS